jgi:hypothetical protein
VGSADSSSQDAADAMHSYRGELGIKYIVLVGILYIVGIGLYAWSPLWLTPPHFAVTSFIYVAIALAWVPVLFLLRHRYKHGVGLLLLGLVINCGWATLFSHRALTIQFLIPFSLECTQETDNDGQVRYTCVREGSDAYTEFHFSGPKGLPVMWRETIRSSSYSGG